MASLPSFDEEKIRNVLEAANRQKEMAGLMAEDGRPNMLAGGEYSALAECIKVVVKDHKVCLDLPLGIGSVCIPIPISIPEGEAAQACLSICTTWGIPTGVKVTVSVGGITIVSKTFGKC